MKTTPIAYALAALLTLVQTADGQQPMQPAKPAGSRTILAPRTPTTLPATQPAQPAKPLTPAPSSPAAVAARDVAATGATQVMYCRGAAQLQAGAIVEPGPPERPMINLIFPIASGPVLAPGKGLKPGECVLEGVTGYYPPAVRFPQAWDALDRLRDASQVLSFDVVPKHGYFEAIASRRVGDVPRSAAVPDNLFQMNEREIVDLGERRVSAGELQRELRNKALAAGGAPHKAMAARAVKEAPAAPPAGPPAIVGVSHELTAQTGAAASVDCVRTGPRIHNTQTRLSPGQRISIIGTCLGSRGTVEIYGSFPAPGSTLRLSATRWTSSGVEALVPSMSGVMDQTVTLAVVRDDGRRSTAVSFPFRAARERRRVPAERWIPTSSPHDTKIAEGDFGLVSGAEERRRYTQAQSYPGDGFKVSASVVVNPACELQELEYSWRGAQLFTVQQWGESTTPNEDRVTLTGRGSCTTTKTDTLMLAGEWKQVCSFAADFTTWASCPVGVLP